MNRKSTYFSTFSQNQQLISLWSYKVHMGWIFGCTILKQKSDSIRNFNAIGLQYTIVPPANEIAIFSPKSPEKWKFYVGGTLVLIRMTNLAWLRSLLKKWGGEIFTLIGWSDKKPNLISGIRDTSRNVGQTASQTGKPIRPPFSAKRTDPTEPCRVFGLRPPTTTSQV